MPLKARSPGTSGFTSHLSGCDDNHLLICSWLNHIFTCSWCFVVSQFTLLCLWYRQPILYLTQIILFVFTAVSENNGSTTVTISSNISAPLCQLNGSELTSAYASIRDLINSGLIIIHTSGSTVRYNFDQSINGNLSCCDDESPPCFHCIIGK